MKSLALARVYELLVVVERVVAAGRCLIVGAVVRIAALAVAVVAECIEKCYPLMIMQGSNMGLLEVVWYFA